MGVAAAGDCGSVHRVPARARPHVVAREQRPLPQQVAPQLRIALVPRPRPVVVAAGEAPGDVRRASATAPACSRYTSGGIASSTFITGSPPHRPPQHREYAPAAPGRSPPRPAHPDNRHQYDGGSPRRAGPSPRRVTTGSHSSRYRRRSGAPPCRAFHATLAVPDDIHVGTRRRSGPPTARPSRRRCRCAGTRPHPPARRSPC